MVVWDGLGMAVICWGRWEPLCDVRWKFSVYACFAPEECLGYGLVVPFLAYRFASLVSNNDLRPKHSLRLGHLQERRESFRPVGAEQCPCPFAWNSLRAISPQL